MIDDKIIIDDKEIMGTIFSPVCTFCEHVLDRGKCKAFPVIPTEIWEGHNDHTKPYKGDGGLRFTRIKADKVTVDLM